jgi:hypothetical protein
VNFVIIVERQAPDKAPLLFITPDALDKESVIDMLSEEQRTKYVVHVLYSDQPSVVGFAKDIKDFLAEEG